MISRVYALSFVLYLCTLFGGDFAEENGPFGVYYAFFANLTENLKTIRLLARSQRFSDPAAAVPSISECAMRTTTFVAWRVPSM